MRILVIGGTGFLGSEIARACLHAGHTVTVMSRAGADVPAGATTLLANRLRLPDLGDQFDGIIDTCCYAPYMVDELVRACGPNRPHYTLISSISVYDDFSAPHLTESHPTPDATADDLEVASAVPEEEISDASQYGAAYGRLKRACELSASEQFDTLVIRLGLIVGPRDYTDRFTYWVRRCDLGGTVPVPGPPDRLWQFIDVRDAASFVVRQATAKISQTFHVTGEPVSAQEVLRRMCELAQPSTRIVWRPLGRFVDLGHRPWTTLPLITPDDPSIAHFQNVSIQSAVDAGLTQRNIGKTISATLEWDRQRRDVPLQGGLSAAQEAALL